VKKDDFMNQLAGMLGNMPEKDKKEILYDYEEHFTMGISEGKTEEEISRSLGDPKSIARQFRFDCAIRTAETDKSTGNILRAVFAAGLLGFFNLVIVLAPFLTLIGLLMGLFAMAFGFTISGAAAFIAVILSPFFPNLIDISIGYIFGVSLSVGLTCLGLLLFIAGCYISKYSYKITIKYLKWNVDFITGRRV